MPELQDVLREHGKAWLARYTPGPEQLKAYEAILACRTASLGIHVDTCEECGHAEISYNSCRNRNCPKCQSLRREVWVAERGADLLDVGYFHVVFTVPEQLNPLFWRNQAALYGLLMRCSWETVRDLAADPRYLGARTGATAVLHTWGRQLQYHPHAHLIVPAGGLATDEGDEARWVPCRRPDFLAPVRAMSKMFRGKLMAGLKELWRKGGLDLGGCASHLAADGAMRALVDAMYETDWVAYCKPPFKNAGEVLRYLGRYTHRVAISNSRIVSMGDGKVTFRYRDNRDGRVKNLTLSAVEFLRRFFMHVLPKGFAKVRHFGILAGRGKRERMALCRELTGTPEPDPVDVPSILRRLLGFDPTVCPVCGGRLVPERRTLGPELLL